MPNLLSAVLRIAFAASGAVLLIIGLGFTFHVGWADKLWPWPYGGLSFLFVGSVFAALGAGSMFVAFSQDWRAAAGGAITFIIGGLGSAAYILWFSVSRASGPGYPLACLLLGLFGLLVLWISLRAPPRDPRRSPTIVVISFWIFAAGLFAAAVLLISQFPYVFPWRLPPDTSAIYGFMFAGLAANYAFVAARGFRGDAVVSLIAFFVYDAILIGPFSFHFENVEPERLPSLLIYMAALVYSGALAVAFLAFTARERLAPLAAKAPGR